MPALQNPRGDADTTLTLPRLRAKPLRYPAFTARYCTRREPVGKVQKTEGWVGPSYPVFGRLSLLPDMQTGPVMQ